MGTLPLLPPLRRIDSTAVPNIFRIYASTLVGGALDVFLSTSDQPTRQENEHPTDNNLKCRL
jgi:NADPH-dependent ferric siderophore reductase